MAFSSSSSPLPYFNALIIPIVNNNKINDVLVYILEAKQFFLGFFSADKYTDYCRKEDQTIYIRCKAFNSMTAGFTTLYTVRIDNPKRELYDKNFVLIRAEFFALPRIYEYKFIKLYGEKKKKPIFSKHLVLKTTDLFSKHSEIYSKCNVNSRVWYLLISALLRPSDINPSNWHLYAFLLEESYDESLSDTM